MTAARSPDQITEQLLRELGQLSGLPQPWYALEELQQQLPSARELTLAGLRAVLAIMARSGQIILQGPLEDRQYALPGTPRTDNRPPAQATATIQHHEPEAKPSPVAPITKGRVERNGQRIRALLQLAPQPMTLDEMASALQLEHKDVLLAVMDAPGTFEKRILGDGLYGYTLKQRTAPPAAPEARATTLGGLGPVAEMVARGMPLGPVAQALMQDADLAEAAARRVQLPNYGPVKAEDFGELEPDPVLQLQQIADHVERLLKSSVSVLSDQVMRPPVSSKRNQVDRGAVREPLLTAAARADEAFLAYLNAHPDPQLAALARASHALWRACAAAGVLR